MHLLDVMTQYINVVSRNIYQSSIKIDAYQKNPEEGLDVKVHVKRIFWRRFDDGGAKRPWWHKLWYGR